MKKRLRSDGGFTLVEVIVVAVIVAVLAAAAIGIYTAYVNSARQSAVENAASSLASFCNAAKNSNNAVIPIADVSAGTNIFDAAAASTWRVPQEMTATVAVTTVTVTHTYGQTRTIPY